MLEILNYIALITGGLLVLLLLLSLLGGIDLDLDFDFDADAGGLGVFKSVLTFLSIGSWTAKVYLATQADPTFALIAGAAAGAVAVWVLSMVLRLLLRQQSNVNFTPAEALAERGKVYLPIPADGEGVVSVRIRGTLRELKARSSDGLRLNTGTTVIVEDVEDNILIVRQE